MIARGGRENDYEWISGDEVKKGEKRKEEEGGIKSIY